VSAFLPILIIAVVFAATGLVTLFVLIAGIHSEERHLNLPGAPRSPAERLARRVLDVHVSQPDALRFFASRHASIQRQQHTRHGHLWLPAVRSRPAVTDKPKPRTRRLEPGILWLRGRSGLGSKYYSRCFALSG
jgi:hypothetical protein